MLGSIRSSLSRAVILAASTALSAGSATLAQAPTGAFTNFESPHVHPLDVTPDGSLLLAVNTADARLEVYAIGPGGALTPAGSVPVGLDPVTVRARSSTEAWVVNHISDSVSIVDLSTLRVRATLATSDEPCDVVFAGPDGRGFVSCQGFNVIQVFDPASLAASPETIAIFGERPRALAVSPDGATVYCAIFESGNRTTILGGGGMGNMTIAFPPNVVSNPAGPYGGTNPPPNAGASFVPARSPNAQVNMPVGLIVRKDDQNRWMDDNNGNWTALVSGPQASASGRLQGWDLADHDCAIINASSRTLTGYAKGLMNICMSIAVNPATGYVAIAGTEALNHIRFEPNVKGTFVRVHLGSFHPSTPTAPSITDLNPHLDYLASTIPQVDRNRSLGDPRGLLWEPSGLRGFVSGMGSNNVIPIDASGSRLGNPINVGEGPTGLAHTGNTLFVLNRFAGSISTINTASLSETARTPFHDATPTVIKTGRKHLFDTHKNSGLGQAACASCHVDVANDRLAWDLGDPSGNNDPLTSRNLGFGVLGLAPAFTPIPFQPFHPMKGPMTTQTLQDIVGKEPHHWRGDRLGLEEFNGAFIGLQGDDNNLSPAEMQEFESYLATVTLPPNPFRNFDNSLPSSLPLTGHFTPGRFGAPGLPLPPGNAVAGMNLYRNTTRRLDGGTFACVTCHTLPTGAGPDSTWNGAQHVPIAPGPMGERHLGLVSVDGSTNISIKVPQTRTIHKKRGFNTTQLLNTAGFGVLHDGSVDSIERFVAEPAFNVASNQEIADLVAFMLAFSGSDLPNGSTTNMLLPPGPSSKDARASVGAQLTLDGAAEGPEVARLAAMMGQANLNRVGLVARFRLAGLERGAFYNGANSWRTDREAQSISHADLLASAAPGAELTITVVPLGAQRRLGVDRDSDEFFDRDELDVCSNPADKSIFPGGRGVRDYNGDLVVDPDDLSDFIAAYFSPSPNPQTDYNGDGTTDPDDLSDFIAAYFGAC
jgi:YVTN family beta-propeller protein